MKEIKEKIEFYNSEIKSLKNFYENSASYITRPALKSQIETLHKFKDVLVEILVKIHTTETPDSILIDKLDKVVEGYDDILISHDYEDGYFISFQERGNNKGRVLDKDISAKRKTLRDAIQAAIDFNPK